MADTAEFGVPERLLLHAIADLGALRVIGPRGVECAGTPVRAIKEGRVVALVSMMPQPRELPSWLSWLSRPSPPRAMSVGAALSSVLPVLAVAPDTVFESEEQLREMLLARENEIASFVIDHSRYVECDLSAGFRVEPARADLAASRSLAALRGETESERQLIQQSLEQAVAGRKGAFLARLRRRIADAATDVLALETDENTGTIRRKILIAREIRDEFRASMLELAMDTGAGAWIRLGHYRPPVSFRRLEISCANESDVNEARAKLGLGETVDCGAIRIAYERTIERTYSSDLEADHRVRLAGLASSFGLLSLVAYGQMKVTHDPLVRFDGTALKSTWLLRLHMHDLADRAA